MFSRLHLTRSNGERYLDRVRLLNTRWFRVYLHRIDSPDPGLDMHDHPWSAARLVLKGSYTEAVADAREAHRFSGNADSPVPLGDRYRVARPWRMARIPRTIAHHITEVHSPVTTLFFSWGKRRPWGFYTPTGWVDAADHPVERRADDLVVTGTMTSWD